MEVDAVPPSSRCPGPELSQTSVAAVVNGLPDPLLAVPPVKRKRGKGRGKRERKVWGVERVLMVVAGEHLKVWKAGSHRQVFMGSCRIAGGQNVNMQKCNIVQLWQTW